MGSGKSTVGELLARYLQSYTFVDTDVVCKSTIKTDSMDKVFEKMGGEEGFRDLESMVLDEVKNNIRCVVGTGGGIVLKNTNWAKLQTGLVVYLKVEVKDIIKRFEISNGGDRPLLKTEDPEQTLAEIYDKRKSLYEQADVVIDVKQSMNTKEVTEAIVKQLHNFIDENPPGYEKDKKKAKEEGLDWV